MSVVVLAKVRHETQRCLQQLSQLNPIFNYVEPAYLSWLLMALPPRCAQQWAWSNKISMLGWSVCGWAFAPLFAEHFVRRLYVGHFSMHPLGCFRFFSPFKFNTTQRFEDESLFLGAESRLMIVFGVSGKSHNSQQIPGISFSWPVFLLMGKTQKCD